MDAKPPNLQPQDLSRREQMVLYKRFLLLVTVLEFVILVSTYISSFGLLCLAPIIMFTLLFEQKSHKLLLLSLCFLQFSSALVFDADSSLLTLPWFLLRSPPPLVHAMPKEIDRLLIVVVHHALFVGCVYLTTCCDCPAFSVDTIISSYLQPVTAAAESDQQASMVVGRYSSRLRELTDTLRQRGIDLTTRQEDTEDD
ncbi:hypothetical protein J8273_7518 [Carpediemonas membranifera]|uniref:Uncharacterized protein n=1 Tax=Carpediemonas membranifera TaxID=201153 RepID=A0A8J6B234_9EUKA|nr:hypothetical protein J8273_7518 [Carpediemonas membranifera]|eukprot:KAG9391244.1 hypothetical protein J8273_7518 [Carpediemonas membranifera]